jgi:hypothetical protein
MHRTLLALVIAGAAVVPAGAAEPQPAAKPAAEPVDAELLEFLGSLDAEEEGWREYLEERPMRATTAKPAEAKPAPRPAAQPVKVDKP